MSHLQPLPMRLQSYAEKCYILFVNNMLLAILKNFKLSNPLNTINSTFYIQYLIFTLIEKDTE